MYKYSNMQIKYKDLDLNFTPHPITHDISQKIDAEAVKRAVRNLILLQFNEKPFHPEINSNISGLLFELDSPQNNYVLSQYIQEIIAKYEPRVNSIYVTAKYNSDLNAVMASIQFRITSLPNLIQLQVPLVRSR